MVKSPLSETSDHAPDYVIFRTRFRSARQNLISPGTFVSMNTTAEITLHYVQLVEQLVGNIRTNTL